MKSSINSRFFLAIILPLIITLAGCSVGIRPASYDLPPEDDTRVYYGEPAYESYWGSYNVPAPPNYWRYPDYDPWTMGTYYEGYSGPAHSETRQVSPSTNTIQSESSRPVTRDRDSASDYQSRAPSNTESKLRRDRISARSVGRGNSPTDSSSATIRKVRRDSRRDASDGNRRSDETKRKESEIQSNSQKTAPESTREPAKSDTEEDKEKEKEKRKGRSAT